MIFSLSQMRTILVVDGEYVFESELEETMIEIRSQEYVFEKHTSYELFAFVDNSHVECVRLQVAQADKIYKKAKLLYLFGGSKAFLLPCGILLFVLLLIAIAFSNGSLWDWIEAGVCMVCFLILFARYKKSLMFLKRAMREEMIFSYLKLSGINYGFKPLGD